MRPYNLIVLALQVLACPLAVQSSIVWTKNFIPLTGELVLTDIHAVLDSNYEMVTALASGEGGVVLKLNQSVGEGPSGNWTTLLDSSYPTYWYGVYLFSPTSYLVSGFIDGSGHSYGVIAFSFDGGLTWTNDTTIDPTNWGGGPIEFANASEGYMPSTSGASAWRTSIGGRSAAAWFELTPSPGNWHAGNYVYDGNGFYLHRRLFRL
jgi:hypothetical protein